MAKKKKKVKLTHTIFRYKYLLLSILTIILGYLLYTQTPTYKQRLIAKYDAVTWDDDFVPHSTLPEIDPNEPQIANISYIGTDLEPSNFNLSDKPNIVFVLTDDQPYNTIGLAGNTYIQTPNIDSLINNGVYFDNMYLPLAWCAPSRASILTGKVPHTHKLTTNRLILPPNQMTLSEILQSVGYHTGIFGKCHLGDPNDVEKYKRGFDVRVLPYPDSGALSGSWYNYQVSKNGVIEDVNQYVTDFYADEAIKFIKESKADNPNTPFFVWFSPFAPHAPMNPPQGQNVYYAKEIPIPVSITDDLSTKPSIQQNHAQHKNFINRGGWDGIRNIVDRGYETIWNIDQNVGKLTDTLKELGVYDNTIFIFMSDNGVMFGAHQLLFKGPFMYEEQVKAPFILHYPNLISSGFQTHSLSSSIDIMPTILDIIGLQKPADVQGQSFLPVIKGERDQYRNSIFIEYFKANADKKDSIPMRGVVAKDFKLVHYLGSKSEFFSLDGRDFELYDLKNDPYELNNLMQRTGLTDNPLRRLTLDPTYGEIVKYLRKQLAIQQTDLKDPRRLDLLDENIEIIDNHVKLTWTSNRAFGSAIDYRSCDECEWQELIFSLKNSSSHSFTLEIPQDLSPNSTFRLYNLASLGNGGYKDVKPTY